MNRRLNMLLAFSLLLCAAAPADDNLLKNPGFENALEPAWEKRTPDDAKRKLYCTSEGAHSGKSCAVLENIEKEYTRLRQGGDKSIAIAPGSLAELTVWVKSDLDEGGAVIVQLYCMGDKEKITGCFGARSIKGKSDWTQARCLAQIPEGTMYVMAYLQVKDGVGKACFDDVQLRVLRGPRPKTPAPRIGVATDLPDDDPCFKNLKVLLGDGLIRIDETSAEKQLGECVGAAVLFRSDDAPKPILDAVVRFAEQGRPVFMDIRNFAAWRGAKAAAVDMGLGDNNATWTFDGPEGTYDIAVRYADENDGAGTIALLHNGRVIDSWVLDATPEKGQDQALTRKIPSVSLRKGDLLALCLSADRGESCRVDAIDLTGPDGKAITVEAEDMKPGGSVKVESPVLMFAKGIKGAGPPSVERRMAAGLRVVKESEATSGFTTGQVMPRAGIGGTLLVLPKKAAIERLEVLAVGPGGEAGLVQLPVGKGRVVAADVLSLTEPFFANVDAYYKYLPITNTLTNRVQFGEYYLRRYKYDEFVERMKQIAVQHPQIRFQEEGPACGDYKICSLNLGTEGKPLYFLYAACHGSEWEPGYGLLTFAKRIAEGRLKDVIDLDKVSIKIVPILNPSGYDSFARKNASGVDLNRQGDYLWKEFVGMPKKEGGEYGPDSAHWKGSAPFTEPEAQTYLKICQAKDLYCVLDFHGNCSATNNKLGILPLTAREDNEMRGFDLQYFINERLRGRFILRQLDENLFSQYLIERVYMSSPTPYLKNTAARGRYGILFELTAGYRSSYGTVLQTDVTCEICRALFKAYPPPD